MTEYKKVTYKNLKKGDVIEGYSKGNSVTYATATILDVNPFYVTLKKFDKYEEKLKSEDYLFHIPLTYKEVKNKHKSTAENIYKALTSNKYSSVQGIEYNADNAWTDLGIYDLAQKCDYYGVDILGWCSLSQPKYTLFGTKLDAAYIFKYRDMSDIFWCHAGSDTIEYNIHSYEKED